jgi:methyltransferase (TIGR00027 family)
MKGVSRTALYAAQYRAAHQTVDNGWLFNDPLALQIANATGTQHDDLNDEQRSDSARRMRLFLAARSRFADDVFLQAINDSTSQVVLLGAGLDTFAYRHDLPKNVTVFEVDHPATQEWKQTLLQQCDIAAAGNLRYVAVDFDTQDVMEQLQTNGLQLTESTVVSWLGVIPYLQRETVEEVLSRIAQLRHVDIALDYSAPASQRDAAGQHLHRQRSQRVAELGEPWITFFETNEIHELLHQHGFHIREDVDVSTYIRSLAGGTPNGTTSPVRLLHASR